MPEELDGASHLLAYRTGQLPSACFRAGPWGPITVKGLRHSAITAHHSIPLSLMWPTVPVETSPKPQSELLRSDDMGAFPEAGRGIADKRSC